MNLDKFIVAKVVNCLMSKNWLLLTNEFNNSYMNSLIIDLIITNQIQR